jgi:flagellar biosynthetic protein FliQ
VDLPSIAADAVRLALSLALPALIAAFVVSVLLSLFDVATQGQDTSLGFVPRLIAVAIVIYVGREFLGTQVVEFASVVMHDIARVQH